MSAGKRIARLKLQVAIEKWPFAQPVHITGYTFHDLDIIVVSVSYDGLTGRGEAAGVYYHNETPISMSRQIESVRATIEAGIDHHTLQALMPAGGARNAVDCALWDLEAKLSGVPAWTLAGLQAPRPLETVYTLSAADPPSMATSALAASEARSLKLKLTGEPVDAARVRAVRAARPDVPIAVDANQGFTRASLESLMPTLSAAGVTMIEQPFRVGEEALLEDLRSPIPIAADESVQVSKDIAPLAGRVDIINIKLDKSGGLTEALAMLREARRHGLRVMIGNMGGTSLAMAPAFLIGQMCEVVDLDGPTFLSSDRSPAALYEHGRIWCPDELWGGTLAGRS